MDRYNWAARSEFVNRVDDLNEMEMWWTGPSRDALALVGRRRVGKSWLFRRFADGKPAVILVADRRLPNTQMARFAEALEPILGVRPHISGVADLIRLLYRVGRDEKVLAVIDEFPLLLPDGRARDASLTEVQAVMEEQRDSSRTKLVLCGSLIGQMESLLSASNPLHGRLRKLDIWPLTFAESEALTSFDDTLEQRVTRFAVTGGMARYIAELGHGDLREAVCARVLNYRSQLFDDPRAILEQELRNPATYFSIFEALADAPASTEHLTGKLQIKSSQLTFYLDMLRKLRLLSSSRPIGAAAATRTLKHRISDGFVRFWFRFVFGNQDALQQGLAPEDLWDGGIAPYLPSFVAPTFEELCARYVRQQFGLIAQQIGGWWGPSLNVLRRTGKRMSEEIDIVGAGHGQLTLAGECKWTSTPMPTQVLDDLREYKIPAVRQAGRLTIPEKGPRILLFSRSGFASDLQAVAEHESTVTLVNLDEVVTGLDDVRKAS